MVVFFSGIHLTLEFELVLSDEWLEATIVFLSGNHRTEPMGVGSLFATSIHGLRGFPDRRRITLHSRGGLVDRHWKFGAE